MLITSLKPPFRLWLLALVAALLILTGCNAATNQPTLIQSQEWLMDKTGHASLQEVRASPDWQPMARWQSWGYGPETIWIRTKLKAAAHDTRTSWIVQIKPPYLDYLTLYDPSANLVLRSGDKTYLADGALTSTHLLKPEPRRAALPPARCRFREPWLGGSTPPWRPPCPSSGTSRRWASQPASSHSPAAGWRSGGHRPRCVRVKPPALPIRHWRSASTRPSGLRPARRRAGRRWHPPGPGPGCRFR